MIFLTFIVFCFQLILLIWILILYHFASDSTIPSLHLNYLVINNNNNNIINNDQHSHDWVAKVIH